MTKLDISTLTASQEVALLALLAGSSITDAAKEAHVSRQAVSGWVNHDAGFVAAINAGRQAAHAAVQDGLRDLGLRAVSVVGRHLDDADDDAALDAALHVLRLLTKLPAPTGSTDPGEVQELLDMRAIFRY